MAIILSYHCRGARLTVSSPSMIEVLRRAYKYTFSAKDSSMLSYTITSHFRHLLTWASKCLQYPTSTTIDAEGLKYAILYHYLSLHASPDLSAKVFAGTLFQQQLTPAGRLATSFWSSKINIEIKRANKRTKMESWFQSIEQKFINFLTTK
jgi:hypothetical protein